MAEKKKYLLIRPKYFATVASVEPLALEYLAAVIQDNNREYAIMDQFVHSSLFRFKRITTMIKKGGYNVVCFTVTANKAHYVIKTAARLKQRFPCIKIIVGGPEVILNYKDFFLDCIDIVYYDPALISFSDIVKRDLSPEVLQKAPGTAYRTARGWLASPPGPPAADYHVMPERRYFADNQKKYGIIGKGCFALLKTSFSCPQACNFCVSRLLNNGVYKERELTAVIAELKTISCDKVWIVDDDFLANPARVEQFCYKVIAENIKKLFMVFARADSIVNLEAILPLMYEAGFRDMLVGLEAVDNKFLAQYHKNSSVAVNEKAVDLLKRHHMLCNGLFVTSQHFNRWDFENIHRFIKRKKLTWVLFSILTPYKGSALYEENRSRLYRYEYHRLGGTRIVLPVTNLSFLQYYFHFFLLYVRRYPKLYWATLSGQYQRLTQYKSSKGENLGENSSDTPRD